MPIHFFLPCLQAKEKATKKKGIWCRKMPSGGPIPTSKTPLAESHHEEEEKKKKKTPEVHALK
jgi:hypothetical protein